jgi:hypothetical protein
MQTTEQGLMAFGGSPVDYLASINANSSNYSEFCEDLDKLIHGQLSELLLAEKCKLEAAAILAWTYQHAVSLYKSCIENSTHANATKNVSMSNQANQLILDCQQANSKIAQAGINKSLILQHIFRKYKSLSLSLK